MANEVSLELTLSCSSTSGGKSTDSSSSDSAQKQDKHRNQAFKIAAMKVYSPKDEEEEEKIKNLSTRLTLYEDSWTIKKVLTNSDVNGSSRLLLSTHVVEEHIVKNMDQSQAERVNSNDGARIIVRDYDTNMSEYELTLKRWPSTGSYVLVNNWKRDFEKRRVLKCNDEIGMLWDPFNSILWFRVLRRDLI